MPIRRNRNEERPVSAFHYRGDWNGAVEEAPSNPSNEIASGAGVRGVRGRAYNWSAIALDDVLGRFGFTNNDDSDDGEQDDFDDSHEEEEDWGDEEETESEVMFDPFASEQPRRKRLSFDPNHYDLPKIELPTWESNEYSKAINEWHDKVLYKLNWIFRREEREGFVRRRVSPFSPQDIEEKLSKCPNHEMNNEESKFFDWVMGGTNFILRLEYLIVKCNSDKHIQEPTPCLRLHFLYKNKLIAVEDRLYSGQRFDPIRMTWAEESRLVRH